MDNLLHQAQDFIKSGKAQEFLASQKGQEITNKYGEQFKSYTGVDIKTVEGFLGINPNQNQNQQNQQGQQFNNNNNQQQQGDNQQQNNNNNQSSSSYNNNNDNQNNNNNNNNNYNSNNNQQNNSSNSNNMSANNQQQPQVSEGQFGQKGQYGAVTGQGFGGNLAKDSQGNSLNSTQEENKQSNYSGYGANDSSASGGFGRNAQGSAYSRANQMGAGDNSANYDGSEDIDHNDGTKTGASTPGYRKDGEDGQDVNSQFRGQNLGFTSSNNDDEPNI